MQVSSGDVKLGINIIYYIISSIGSARCGIYAFLNNIKQHEPHALNNK